MPRTGCTGFTEEAEAADVALAAYLRVRATQIAARLALG
jgi:hypothetical protein